MKILLADDHALFREGMHYVMQQLANQLDGQAEILDAGNFSDALGIAEKNPDLSLALLDLKMPGSDGVSAIKLFHSRYPDIPVVVVSGADQREDIMGVMNSGAMGFISKSSNCKDMIQALRMVLDGGTYLPPQLLQQDVAGAADGRSRAGHPRIRSTHGEIVPRIRAPRAGSPRQLSNLRGHRLVAPHGVWGRSLLVRGGRLIGCRTAA